MMKWKNGSFIIALAIGAHVSFMTVAEASEPQRPEVNRVFDMEKEQKINMISSQSAGEAFEGLKDVEFLLDEDLLNKAIYKTFHQRKQEGIALSLQSLSLPEKEIINGRKVHRAKDIYLARKIAEVFPDESAPVLVDLYGKGDATTKGNVVRVSGRMEGKIARNLLMKALDDKTFSGPEDPGVDGPPMRICDLAYNQLVLRYRIRNVLRTIGPIDRIENRDYHINILKGRL